MTLRRGQRHTPDHHILELARQALCPSPFLFCRMRNWFSYLSHYATDTSRMVLIVRSCRQDGRWSSPFHGEASSFCGLLCMTRGDELQKKEQRLLFYTMCPLTGLLYFKLAEDHFTITQSECVAGPFVILYSRSLSVRKQKNKIIHVASLALLC